MPRSFGHARCIGVLAVAGLLACGLTVRAATPTAPAAPTQSPLHERIDQLIEAAAIGPLAEPASDADFVRRVYLDLAGMIPSADEARAFLADTAADKRAKLIERLVASPEFSRHLMHHFDLALMERRAGKNVKDADWQAYLFESFEKNKPYHELVREILVADGVDEKTRARAKFLLDRECEPNTLTRDVGRLFFGMDMQCAQCHDHPLIDDYVQDRYYGLQAFLVRTTLFADKKTKLSVVAEKADGETNYKSVFTQVSLDRVVPRLPMGDAMLEKPLPKGEEYQVPPAKDVRPVPKFSRREQLARLATSGQSQQFNRNAANRLWAMMLGRGIVHPLDFQHPDNPPTHPELLALLADEFRAMNYDVKRFVREVALTRTYQRSIEAPRPEDWKAGQIAPRLAQLAAASEKATANLAKTKAAAEATAAALAKVREQYGKPPADAAKLDEAVTKAKAAVDEATAALEKLQKPIADKNAAAAAVLAGAEKTKAALVALPKDKPLVDAQRLLDERHRALAAEAVKLKQQADAQGKVVAQRRDALAAAQQAAQKALDAQSNSAAKYAVVDDKNHDAQEALAAAKTVQKAALVRLTEARQLAEFEQLWAKDPPAARRLWDALVERWTNQFQVSLLKPLGPEQFATSLAQATGFRSGIESTNRKTFRDKPPKELASAAEAEKQRAETRFVEDKTYAGIRPAVNAFVNLYGSKPGEDFSASLDQALFFGNASTVDSWVKPRGGSLSERMAKVADPVAMADELYLAVLTRPATNEERASVTEYLKPRAADRAVAIEEMIWALLSSNEFRFNH